MILYDNLEDVKTKLVSTFCYYKGKAVMVREVLPEQDPITGEITYIVRLQHLNARSYKHCRLQDPDFNYMFFNIGYSNHGHSAAWWYRNPVRQYRQGLKNDQLRRQASNAAFHHQTEWSFNKPIVDMMENSYPSFDDCEKLLKDKEAEIMAFHRDFACTWDRVHKDMIIEYKGKQIGCMGAKHQFKPMDEYEHLTEALKEAVA